MVLMRDAKAVLNLVRRECLLPFDILKKIIILHTKKFLSLPFEKIKSTSQCFLFI